MHLKVLHLSVLEEHQVAHTAWDGSWVKHYLSPGQTGDPATFSSR